MIEKDSLFVQQKSAVLLIKHTTETVFFIDRVLTKYVDACRDPTVKTAGFPMNIVFIIIN